MNESWKQARKLLNLVTSAIDCILRNQYDRYTRKPFYVELGTEVGPGASHTAEEIERVIEVFLRKPELYPPETAAAFLALKEEYTRERLEAFLKAFVRAPLAAALALSDLKEAKWEDVLYWIDSYLTQGRYLEGKIGELVVEGREGFSSPVVQEMESAVDTSPRDFLALYVVRKYAKELKENFPHVVERAQLLRVVPASKNVPNHVREYLEETSRCFIYGHFLASLLVCRSAIEAAVKDRLRDKGYARELREKEDSLMSILDLALEKGLMDKTVCGVAQDIRKMAGKAAHPETVPDEGCCKWAFDATRGVLQHLYE